MDVCPQPVRHPDGGYHAYLYRSTNATYRRPLELVLGPEMPPLDDPADYLIC